MPRSANAVAVSTFRFVGRSWLAVARGLWLALALVFVAVALIGRQIGCLALGACAAPTHGLSNVAAIAAWGLALAAVVLVLLAVMQAFAWRLVLAPGSAPPPWFAALRFGADEARLAALGALRLVLALLVALVVVLALAVPLLALRHLTGTLAPTAGLIALLAALACACFVDSRLSLAGPAAVQTHRLRLLPAWRATRHRVAWLRRIDGTLMLPALLVELALALVFIAWVFAHPGATVASASFAGASLAQACALLRHALAPGLWPFLTASYLVALAFASLMLTGRALAYQAATGSDSGAAWA